MAENFPNLVKSANLRISTEQTPNRINPKKSMPGHIIIKLLKTKDKKYWEQPEQNDTLSVGATSSSESIFFIWSCGSQKRVDIFSTTERKKKLPTGNAVLIETILQECIGKRHPQMKAN